MNIIIISILAGIAGTGVGGVLTALYGNRSDKVTSCFLSFAGGVMTSIVLLELIPEAAAHAGTLVAVAGLVIGVIVVLLLNSIIDRVSGLKNVNTELHKDFEEFYHEEKMIAEGSSRIRSGLLMFFVIGIHNIPEGLAIGAAGNHDMRLGLTLALMIGIHNIPEGLAIAAPLISGGLSHSKTILLTLLAGAPTVLGALIGAFVGGVSDVALAVAYSTAGGAMLYAVFGEILPQTMVISKDRLPTIILLVGVVCGMLLSKI
ncbi:MAG: ZIP family metal transporter [Peptococcaceae bacterium]|jgi:ZIP family zinc transporter|nr:ZIP family metal transporter [Peptococcaceae bacterium]